MIKINKHQLKNGLRIVHYQNSNTQNITFNILYNVGSKHEQSDKTGFAHLLEHLMFTGSKNAPDFDAPIEKVGGSNNAFTCKDFTNYYITLPKDNIELAFWLESDRLAHLNISKENFDSEKQVVIEEFKQYLNEPYGDKSALLSELCYTNHPYKWDIIGKDYNAIANYTLSDINKFKQKYYAPNNAILSITGNCEFEEVIKLSEKWFSDIPSSKTPKYETIIEPIQTQENRLTVKRKNIQNLIHKTYNICGCGEIDYMYYDIISDILANGKSSRLKTKLVDEQSLFTTIDAYVSSTIDNGHLNIVGKVKEGIDISTAEQAIIQELNQLRTEQISEYELNKYYNKYEANHIYSIFYTEELAADLAKYELLNNVEAINQKVNNYKSITSEQIQQYSNKIFKPENCNTLIMLAE